MKTGGEGSSLITTPRILVHFSCGAASAVAWKVTEERYGKECEVEAVYADMSQNEHPDNARFMVDVERWVGKKVTVLSHPKYKNIDTLFLDTKFIVAPSGAICTRIMKREVGESYQRSGDRHVFGYTADERARIIRFNANNPDLNSLWVLAIAGITKEHCYRILSAAGIELPTMYKLGYGHNNCIGCVKGGKGYWNKIRRDFPEVFARRALVQREVGVKFGGGNGFFLDELDPDVGRNDPPEDIECGPYCSRYTGMVDDAVSKITSMQDAPPLPKVLR